MTKPKFLPANTNKTGHDLPVQEFVFPLSVLGSGAEIDTGHDLPDEGIILKAAVNVRTAEATGTTKTLALGILSGEAGGDADGFATAVNVSAVGLKLVTGGALGPADHILDGVARSVSVTAASANFAELVADLHVWVYTPTEVL